MKLTQQQLAYFDTFGYLMHRQVFTVNEMAKITRVADDLWQRARPKGANESTHQRVSPFVEPDPQLAWLAEDDRVYEPMAQLLGDGFIWGGSEGDKGSFNTTNDQHWHCDRHGFLGLDYGLIKLMIYLEPTTKDTGALRVIPGSHRVPFGKLLKPLNTQQAHDCPDLFGVEGEDLPCVILDSQPGDLVMFNHYLYHGVYHKHPNRRYITMKFAAKPTTTKHVAVLRAHGQDASCLAATFRNSARPRIRAMVEHLIASDQLC